MFDKLFSLFSYDIGIDLGTANTLVFVKGKGIVIREPSVVAIHKKTKKIISIGTEAKKMLGKTPATILIVKPLRGGVIADFDATAKMISYYIQSVHQVGNILPAAWSKPKVVIGIPSAVTEVQRRAVWEAALSAGAREAFLIEEPMAAAIGEEISVFSPTGSMIVDIGGGTTEIAVISLGGIVLSKSFLAAGDEMDRAISHYIRLRHGLLLGEKTTEEVKLKIGSASESKFKIQKAKIKSENEKNEDESHGEKFNPVQLREKVAVVRGRDIETGFPKSLKVTEVEVREALAPVVSEIIEGISDALEDAPPELVSDILEHGILLTGGGSLLPGIEDIIAERTRIPVIKSEDPLTSVVKGTGKVLEDESLLERVKVIGGLK
ncbi:MAG: rod shape-determining protein [Candidatus Levybacteria bacterium RIFCSPLOWO2_01_FULL_38_13]|nr:MAG: rod shape-determining protein [Candidatus Levybacteria bacterium RIFCSPHIGHO2_01_FULL_41_15]OGH35730.1 MAG: rod shape-determining protein [Candidatus Levybacteria bacterium RIFCSPLOWO2_01_FULL_38_13]